MSFQHSFSALLASLVQLVHNRVELFGLEIAQEKDRGLRLFTQAAIAAIFLWLSASVLTFLVAAFFWDTPYRLVVLAALGVCYGLIGMVLMMRARAKMAAFNHAFTATVDELKRDAKMFATLLQDQSDVAEPKPTRDASDLSGPIVSSSGPSPTSPTSSTSSQHDR